MSGSTFSPKLEGEPSPSPEGRGAHSRGLTQSAIVASVREAPRASQAVTPGHGALMSSVQGSLQTLNETVEAMQSTLRNEYSKATETLNDLTQATLTTLEMYSSHVPFVVTELGEFDGNSQNVLSFLANLRYLLSTSPNETATKHLIGLIPRCLQGKARAWYTSLSATYKRERLSDFEGWDRELKTIFPPDYAKLQLEAEARSWVEADESITAYYFDKTSKLALAFPDQTPEEEIVAVIAGLAPRFALLLQKGDLSWPSRTELLEVLQKQEARWRQAGP